MDPPTPTPQGDARHTRTAGQSRPALLAGVLCLALIALCLHAATFFPFLEDDALISLRYAWRLLQGHGLTWTAGARVEGYSNLLWTLCVAAVGAFGVDLVVAARALCFASGAAIVLAIGYHFRRALPADILGAAVAAAVVALAAPLAAWIPGSLEQPSVAALLAWGVVLLAETAQRPEARLPQLLASMALGALWISRPDTPLLVAMLIAAAWLHHRKARVRRGIQAVFLGALVPAAAQLVFRLAYYGDWLPNTARVKLALSSHYAQIGLNYAGHALMLMAPLTVGIVALFALAWRQGPTPRAHVGSWSVRLLPAAVGWMLYLIVVGGDHFPAYRQIVPVLVLLALLFGELARAAHDARLSRAVVFAIPAMTLVLFAIVQPMDPHVDRARRQNWVWGGKEVGLFLKARFGKLQPVLALEAAGAVPFWSELPCIDLLGLNDAFVGRHPSPWHGRGWPGHDNGDADHVLSQRPDLILLKGPRGAVRPLGTPIEVMLASHPEFNRDYVPIEFRAPDRERVVTTVYLRRGSARIDWEALARDAITAKAVAARPDELPYVHAVPER